MKRSLSIVIMLSIGALLSGCIVSKTPNTNDVNIPFGEQVTFSIVVFPPTATYAWTLDEAPLSNAESSYVYTAQGGEHFLTVKAKHIFGTDTQTWTILTNSPPVAHTGPDQTVAENEVVTLDASNSTDPDGDIVSYAWEQIGGIHQVVLSNPSGIITTFQAPEVDEGGEALTFKLTVTDNTGLTATATCIVNVTWKNDPPTAVTGPNQTVAEGMFVTLDGSNSTDPDDGIATYEWKQIGGPIVVLVNADTMYPTFTTPDVGPAGVALTFELTVTDKGGLKSAAQCIVNVTWINAPPTAVTGPDQTVDEGVLVTLDGSASTDPDDGIASYAWQQKEGPPVTLSNAGAMQPTFTTPNVGPAGAALKFELTVTDNGGLKSTATCIVNVTWVNDPPTANAGLDQSVSAGAVVTLNGGGSSDPDDGIASYLWVQTGGPTVTLTNADTAIAQFTAFVAAGSVLTFELTVTDAGGLQATDTCVITVTNLSDPISDLLNSMVSIPAGTFMMGSTDNEYGWAQYTTPVHAVTLQAFEIGAYEVTQAQYAAVMGTNPSYFQGTSYPGTENNPVDRVTYYEAREFCTQLSALTGRTFTLPSEAQWEYACRAGSTTLYSFGDDDGLLGNYAWYDSNSGDQTHPVGTKLPNAWDLYDMHGNVWEWCLDSWHENYIGAPTDGSAWEPEAGAYRMIRGGGWNSHGPWYCRSAMRYNYPAYWLNYFGFRVLAVPAGG